MKKLLIITLPVILGFYFISCTKKGTDSVRTYAILVDNTSNTGLLVYYQLNYPDTTIQQYKPEVALITQRSVGYMLSTKKWDELISQNADSTIMFFFMTEKTLKENPWDSVRVKYLILKRKQFTLDSLQKLDWAIQYP